MQFFDLGRTTGSDKDRSNLRLAQDPGYRQLSQTLATLPGYRSQFPSAFNHFLANILRFQNRQAFPARESAGTPSKYRSVRSP